MLGECSAHKGDASDVYRNNPTECRASICFSAKNTNKIRERVRQGKEDGKRGGMWEKWFGFFLKTSHQFAAAAKQFTLDIVNFRRSSAKKEREQLKPNHKKARDGQG